MTLLAAIMLMIATPGSLADKQLPDPAREQAAVELMHSLRCVQCQGQSIADSDAPIAAAMRSEVRRRMAAGESADSVRQWMIGRYGEWVSFEPPASGSGLLLWILPLIVLGGAVFVASRMFMRRRA